MGLYRCGRCGFVMIDPDLYFQAKPNQKRNRDMLIKCPSCGRVTKIVEIELSDKEFKKKGG